MEYALLAGLFLSVASVAGCGATVSGSGTTPSPVDGGDANDASETGDADDATDGGYATIDGEVGDAYVAANSDFAILSEITYPGQPNGQIIAMTFTSRANWTCGKALAAAAAFQQLATTESFEFGVENGSGAIGPGAYTVTAGQAYGQIVNTDATCDVTQVFANAGTITLTEVGGDVVGSYDLTFGTHGKLSGSFGLPLCIDPMPIGPSPPPPGPPVCVQ